MTEEEKSFVSAINALDKESKQDSILDDIVAEMEEHRRKTQYIDPYDLVGDCLDIINEHRTKARNKK